MKKSLESVIDWLVLFLFVIVITISVFVHDCLASSFLVWLKKITRRTIELFLLMVFVFVLKVLLFVDDYLLVSPMIWIDRSGKFIFCLLLLAMTALAGNFICRALGPHAGLHSVIQLIAGMLSLIIVLIGFHYRHRVWSLS